MLVGTFIEELVSPIPAFAVLIPTGLATQVQGHTPWFLLVLALLSSTGRILAAMILYWLAHKFEDILLGKGRRFLGATHGDVEKLRQRLSSKAWHNWLAMFVMNALPIFPGAFLSTACGFIKLNFAIFVSATFFGSMVSALFFLSVGYFGLQGLLALHNLELATQIVGAILVLALVTWLVKKQSKK